MLGFFVLSRNSELNHNINNLINSNDYANQPEPTKASSNRTLFLVAVRNH